MIFNLQINKNCEESVTATVHKRTSLIDEIEGLVMSDNVPDKLASYYEDEITLLKIKLE